MGIMSDNIYGECMGIEIHLGMALHKALTLTAVTREA